MSAAMRAAGRMDVLVGTVDDTRDDDTLVRVTFVTDDGRQIHLAANSGDSLAVANIQGAMAHGDRIVVHCENGRDRSGDDVRLIRLVEVLDHQIAVDLELAA